MSDTRVLAGDIKKILVRSANWVGDAVMGLPAIAAVRHAFPRAQVSVLAKPWVAEIFEGNPSVERVILYHSPGEHQGIGGRWRLARVLRGEGFDLALLLPNSFDSALTVFLAGIPRRAGYRRDLRGPLLTHPVSAVEEVKRCHQVDYYLHMIEAIGLPPAGRTPALEPIPERVAEISPLLRSREVREEEPLLGISPGAAYGSAKEWFPERYGRVAERVAEELGARVLIVGSRGDRDVASRVQRGSRAPLVDLTGLTTLGQAMALISRCRLFLTNDSGLMHVSAALGVPTVAIFGSTDPQKTGPLGASCRVMRKPLPCSPCFKSSCPKDRECMGLITAEDVMSAIQELWAHGSAPLQES